MDSPQVPKKSKAKTHLQTAGLLLLLLGLPLASWYYLSLGLDYQKTAIAELKNYGNLPAFHMFDQDDQIITLDSLKGNMVLASFFKLDAPETAARFKILRALHEQFDDRDNILFLQHLLSKGEEEVIDFSSFAKKHKFEDYGQIFYLLGSPGQIKNLLIEGYKIPQKGLPKDENGQILLASDITTLPNDYPYFVLMDEHGKIRNYYDSREAGQMKRLVEHMALVMPR